MAERRLIYLTAWRATAYVARRGQLLLGPTFANDEDGHDQLARYLRDMPGNVLLYVLADVVEEDFHIETIPFVRGSDRKQLVGRRLAQRYRDTSLSLALSLGTERSQRRDERVLLSSFTNTQLFEPWLNVLQRSEHPLVGVYSVALVAAALANRLGFGIKERCLMVSLQPAGLRQALVWERKIRFSRLGPLEPADADQPTRVAAAFAGETVRIHQYLTAVRMLPREGPQLDVLLIAPTGRKQLVAAAASDTAQLRYHVVEVVEAAHRIGLRDLPPHAGAEALYLHLLATETPRQQYASEPLRERFRTWQGRMALQFGGGALAAACLLMAGYQWLNIMDARSRTVEEQQRARAVSEDFARVTQSFPKVPTSSENLKFTVENYAKLVKLTRDPGNLLTDLAAVLDTTPNLEVESLRWDTGVSPRDRLRDAKKGATGAPASTPAGAASPTANEPRFDVLEVTGRVDQISATNYRALAAAVNDMVEKLRKRSGIEVISAKLPFDIGSEASLSGDISEARATDIPRFTVTFGRRVGS